MLLITCRNKSGLASGEFVVSANTAYSEVKIKQVGDRGNLKIVGTINTQSCRFAEQSATSVVQREVSDYETVGENEELSG